MKRILICFTIILWALSQGNVNAQISSSALLKEGDKYFEHGQYRVALKQYQDGGNKQTWKKETLFRVGICQFEINRVAESIQSFNQLVEEGKTEPEVYYYLGKAFQHLDQYDDAIRFYKRFLRKKNTDENIREWVKDEIIRCANGMQYQYGEEIAYVENLGAVLNTFGDEVGANPSPNFRDRVYFSSNRNGSTGRKVNAKGDADSKYGVLPFDIYSIERTNGAWRNVMPISGETNSQQHEMIADFSIDGQVLYYFQGKVLDRGRMMADTFVSNPELPKRRGLIAGHMKAEFGDQDLQFINDTMMMFSSARPGGYGGFDLYISINRYGRWMPPVNLGPEINSYYDERCPFLTTNGRTLFFSSNNLSSIGGYDVFRADFQDETKEWGMPKNIGMPINSPGNELYFIIESDGLSALLSSDRKTGFGGYDIYSVYLKNQLTQQLQISVPTTFYQVEEYQSTDESSSKTNAQIDVDRKEYYVSDLYYSENDVVVTPQNIKKLDLYSNMLLIYPKLRVEFVCHETSDSPAAFTLYFSIKKAEKARDYLVQKGVDAARVDVRGAGKFYPYGSASANSPLMNKLNRRIDVRFYNDEQEPIEILVDQQSLPDPRDEQSSRDYIELTEGLSYKIQIAATNQMYQNTILDNVTDAIVEYDDERRNYRYLVHLDSTHAEAKAKLNELRSNGYPDAFIVPYVDGVRIERNNVLDYTNAYPDLLNLFGG